MNCMSYDHDRATALVDEAAYWAVNNPEVEAIRDKFEPLSIHFAEVSNLAIEQVLITVAKALEAGFYFGKYGFPEDRVPDAFKKAFKESEEKENGN